MIKIGDDCSWRKDVAKEIRRLEHLLFDLNSLYSAGGYPGTEELAAAQVLRNPMVQPRAVPSIVGMHEVDGRRTLRQTSPVVLLGPGWARTWNSLYKLETGHE